MYSLAKSVIFIILGRLNLKKLLVSLTSPQPLSQPLCALTGYVIIIVIRLFFFNDTALISSSSSSTPIKPETIGHLANPLFCTIDDESLWTCKAGGSVSVVKDSAMLSGLSSVSLFHTFVLLGQAALMAQGINV